MADIVTEASPMLPHPPGGNCETVADPSVGCFAMEGLQSAIVMGEGLRPGSAFVGGGNSITSLARSPVTDCQLSAVKARRLGPPRRSAAASCAACIQL